MNKKEIKSGLCRKYLANKDKFRWFIEKYFGVKMYVDMWEIAEQDRESELRDILNGIWDELPGTVFNVQTNPPGWETFLQLVEN